MDPASSIGAARSPRRSRSGSAVFGLALLATRPGTPPARAGHRGPRRRAAGRREPAGQPLGDHRGRGRVDAARPGARHILEFRQPGNDPLQTTVHVRQPNPAGLTPYEQRVFDRVAALRGRRRGAADRADLPRRRPGQRRGRSGCAAEVIAEARARGLSRRRFGPADGQRADRRRRASPASRSPPASLLRGCTAPSDTRRPSAAGARRRRSSRSWRWPRIAGRPRGERDTAGRARGRGALARRTRLAARARGVRRPAAGRGRGLGPLPELRRGRRCHPRRPAPSSTSAWATAQAVWSSFGGTLAPGTRALPALLAALRQDRAEAGPQGRHPRRHRVRPAPVLVPGRRRRLLDLACAPAGRTRTSR